MLQITTIILSTRILVTPIPQQLPSMIIHKVRLQIQHILIRIITLTHVTTVLMIIVLIVQQGNRRVRVPERITAITVNQQILRALTIIIIATDPLILRILVSPKRITNRSFLLDKQSRRCLCSLNPKSPNR